MIYLYSLISVLGLFVSQAYAAKSECRCRKTNTGVYLEMITYKNEDSMKVSALESFTTKDNSQNRKNCEADLKTRPACGGAAPKPQPKAKRFSIRIEAKQMNETFYKVGLLPGDLVLSIDKTPVTSATELNKISEKAEKGGRIDLEVQRKDSVLDLWYDFPKAEENN